jgi:hypothetical protein
MAFVDRRTQTCKVSVVDNRLPAAPRTCRYGGTLAPDANPRSRLGCRSSLGARGGVILPHLSRECVGHVRYLDSTIVNISCS